MGTFLEAFSDVEGTCWKKSGLCLVRPEAEKIKKIARPKGKKKSKIRPKNIYQIIFFIHYYTFSVHHAVLKQRRSAVVVIEGTQFSPSGGKQFLRDWDCSPGRNYGYPYEVSPC